MGIDTTSTAVPKFDDFQILKEGTVSLTLNLTIGGSNSTSVAHGLKFAPFVVAFVYGSGFSYQLPYVVVNSFASGATLQGRVAYQIYWYADTTNVYFYYEGYTQGTGGSVSIKYFVVDRRSS